MNINLKVALIASCMVMGMQAKTAVGRPLCLANPLTEIDVKQPQNFLLNLGEAIYRVDGNTITTSSDKWGEYQFSAAYYKCLMSPTMPCAALPRGVNIVVDIRQDKPGNFCNDEGIGGEVHIDKMQKSFGTRLCDVGGPGAVALLSAIRVIASKKDVALKLAALAQQYPDYIKIVDAPKQAEANQSKSKLAEPAQSVPQVGHSFND